MILENDLYLGILAENSVFFSTPIHLQKFQHIGVYTIYKQYTGADNY